MHRLLIEDDEGKTVAVPLIREEITIGRVEGNTIRLTEQNVSRRHARLTLRNGVLSIEDLGSYNGTSLNGSALSGVSALKDGDVILIGDYRLGIQEEKVAQAEPSGSPAAASAAPAPAPASAVAPVVQENLEGQPTIPVSTMAAQNALGDMAARLVVVGRLLAGAEFALDRPSLVLGRTQENDIILNHKSISRHHAKIVREGDRYVILDLESANGVRVNGKEHDRLELQGGDVIELGEVRLRFITGDTALYEDGSPWYRDKTKLTAVLAASAAGLGVLLYLAFSGGSGHRATVVAPPAPTASAPSAQPAAPSPAPVPPPPPPSPAIVEPVVPLPELLASAKLSAQEEKWDEALALVAKAVAQEPGSTDAANLRRAIDAEREYAVKVAALTAAAEKEEWDTVLAGAAEIPDESMYKPRVVELHKQAQAGFVAAHLEVASAKLAAKECDEARREAELVLEIEAKNKRAATILRRCEALAAAPSEPTAAPKPARRAPAPVVAAARPAPAPKAAPSRAPEPARSEPASAADPDKLIKDAQQAWLRGQHAAAIDSARKALRVKPNLTNAYQIIAICSCALHDADAASKAYEKLDERNKLYVKSSCQKNGISF